MDDEEFEPEESKLHDGMQEQLYALMALADAHQKAVQSALDGLVIQSATIVRERGSLADTMAKAVSRMDGLTQVVKNSAAEAASVIAQAAGMVAVEAVRKKRWRGLQIK